MYKIFVFVPKEYTDILINSMSEAGAGIIGNYTHNAFIVEGLGNWKSEPGSNPTIGEIGKMTREPENKIEMICPEEKLNAVIESIKKVHPYETPAIDVVKIELIDTKA